MTKPIKAYSLPELEQLLKELGQPSFRSKQLSQWLYIRHASSYDEMSDLPLSLRTNLSESHPLLNASIVQKLISSDGTRKYLIEFEDGVRVETVAIPSHDKQHLTVCFSSQAGCPMSCAFCATGHGGFTRNLLVGEMVDQVLIAQEDMGKRVSNLVVMGQGEPFLNYDNVLGALKIFNSADLLAIGARHITVSTCGIVPKIYQFSEESEQFTLAVSLHAARQGTRDQLMPRVSNFPLTELKSALQTYVEKTNRRVTFEYIMLKNLNDTKEDFRALTAFCKNLLCHINLIPMNEIDNSPYKPSSKETIELWKTDLCEYGIETTIRESRGADIQGACGQLKNSYRPSTK